LINFALDNVVRVSRCGAEQQRAEEEKKESAVKSEENQEKHEDKDEDDEDFDVAEAKRRMLMCEQCNDEPAAAHSFCFPCAIYFCDLHFALHNWNKECLKHKQAKVGDIELSDILKARLAILFPSRCKIHRQRELDNFCFDCELIICSSCFFYHNYKLDQLNGSVKEGLQDTVDKYHHKATEIRELWMNNCMRLASAKEKAVALKAHRKLAHRRYIVGINELSEVINACPIKDAAR